MRSISRAVKSVVEWFTDQDPVAAVMSVACACVIAIGLATLLWIVIKAVRLSESDSNVKPMRVTAKAPGITVYTFEDLHGNHYIGVTDDGKAVPVSD